MQDDIAFRPYQPSDQQALSDIIRKTWQYDRFASAKIANRMARLYLDSCLANQTYTQVAVQNGRPLGIIMAKNCHLHRCSLSQGLRFLRSLLAVLINSEGRRVMKIFSSVQNVDNLLLKDAGKSYDGEIAFFALASGARGKGLGRQLFQKARLHLHTEGIRRCFLFTDTTCNYPFYEHLGLSRRAERKRTLPIDGERSAMTFFIYDFQP
ncbi:MAG: GNAT family N-acetyltransferase [Peptococcaceae bacterium]|nr:GNAT family N-acetyltransferase [Peptococcaceae bacterium]